MSLKDGPEPSVPSLALSDITIEEVPPRSLPSPSDANKSDSNKETTAKISKLTAPFQGFQEESGELVDIREPVAEVGNV